MKLLLSILFFTLASTFSWGQSSTYAALNQFLNTDFFKQYEELRKRSEVSVGNFKHIQDRYSEEEVQNVIDAYNSSAEYFNATLLNIKNDLLDKDKRKYMIKYPDSYAKQIEADLYRAKEYYANTYQREVTELTNGEITGAALTALLPQIIKFAKLAIQLFKKVKNELRNMNESILEKYLMEPYQFRQWNEVT